MVRSNEELELELDQLKEEVKRLRRELQLKADIGHIHPRQADVEHYHPQYMRSNRGA